MIFVVTLYYSNWIQSWSTQEHFTDLYDALQFCNRMCSPDLQTISIVRRKKI